MVTWNMTNRYSSAEEMKANYQFGGRPVETAFQGGPSFVQIDFEFDNPSQGPLWAHYYGDGTFVGSELLVTARENRRHYAGRKAGLRGGLSNREILARLAPTRNWNVAVTDSSGRVIFRSDFLAPFSADMERLFRAATIDYDSRVSDFRRNCQPNDPDDIQGL